MTLVAKTIYSHCVISSRWFNRLMPFRASLQGLSRETPHTATQRLTTERHSEMLNWYSNDYRITILQIAEILVTTATKQNVKLRALVDTCARTNVITPQAQKPLGLQETHFGDRKIGVIYNNSRPVQGQINMTIFPKFGKENKNCVKLDTITVSRNPE